jgi:hypothetical protein
MRVGRRRGILLGALLAVAVICFTVPAMARWWIERRLAAASGLAVQIGGLEPTWAPLGIALRDVALRAVPEGPPLVAIGRIERPLRGGRTRVIGPVVAVRDADGPGFPAAGEGSAAVRRFAIVDAELVSPVLEIVAPGGGATALPLPDAVVEELAGEVLSGGDVAAKGRVALAAGAVAGRVNLRAARPGRPGAGRIAADLRLTSIPVANLGALATDLGFAAGDLDGKLRYRGAAGAGAGRVRGRLVGEAIRWVEPSAAWRLEAARVELAGLDVDVAARRFAVRRAALADGELTLSRKDAAKLDPAVPARPAEAWTASAGSLDVRDLVVRSEAIPDLPGLELLRVRGRELGGPSGRFALHARPTSGGELRAEGEIDARVPRFRADMTLDGVRLGPWLEPFARRIRVPSGSLGGRFEIAGPPGVRGSGELRLEELHVVAAPDGEEGYDLARLGRLSASLRGFTLAPRRVWLTSAEMTAPELTLTRRADGLEPLSLWSGGAGTEDEADARAALASAAAVLGDAPALELPSIEVKAQMRDGRLRFRDEAVSPPFAIELEGIDGTLAAWGGPPWGKVRAELDGRVDGGAPLAARAEIDGQRFAVGGEVAKLPLPPWSTYLVPTIGYAATAGQMSASFALDWEKGVRAPTRLTLEGVALERRPGEDRLGAMLGMPLEHALELMSDSSGRGELVLRLEGDPGAPALGLVAALPAALREAVPEAVSVPLFEGAEAIGKEEDGHVRLAPLRFTPGEAEIPTAQSGPLERLAVVLRWDPVLVATVQGQSGAEDRRPLARGEHEGETLERLAARRGEAVRARLVEALGIAPERVQLLPATSGGAGVRIEVRPAEEKP